ncbi:hypothetical protein F2P81_008471 [Scophthalmus maximus]|uniref:IGFBP N-terminal domain-containing protein n=1 Tax=Scophthalmus maximus TaxID=52904 RepID=A0A6A4SYC2_SCOMX|nr:hypothetical protein F2P81_008471 [Scophthalmus maximus]
MFTVCRSDLRLLQSPDQSPDQSPGQSPDQISDCYRFQIRVQIRDQVRVQIRSQTATESRSESRSDLRLLQIPDQSPDQSPGQSPGQSPDQISDCYRVQVRVQVRVQIRDLHQTTMKSFILFLCLVPVLSNLSILPVHSVRVSAGPGCGPCAPDQCAPLPAEGCPAGSLLDSCGCCSVCAAAEGALCGGRRAATRRCGSGLECVRSDENKKNKLGTCACKSNYDVCGTDGMTYRSGCALKSASLTAQTEGKEPINVQNKGRCATGESDVIQVLSGKKKMELLPGDRDNLAIQTRGGPEKHEVTGWVLISPLTKAEEGSYECHATNSKGEASAVGTIHLVQSADDIIVKTVVKLIKNQYFQLLKTIAAT